MKNLRRLENENEHLFCWLEISKLDSVFRVKLKVNEYSIAYLISTILHRN